MLVAIAVFAIGHPSRQKLSNQASRKFGLGGRGGSSSNNYDVDSSSGGLRRMVCEEGAPEEAMWEEDREEIAAEEAEEAQEEAAEEAAEMGVNNDATEALPTRANMSSMAMTGARWELVCDQTGRRACGVIQD